MNKITVEIAGHGGFDVSGAQLDWAMNEFLPASVSQLQAKVADIADNDYSDVVNVSELLIVLADAYGPNWARGSWVPVPEAAPSVDPVEAMCDGAKLDNCPTCDRRITDDDPEGFESESGQRFCLSHRAYEVDDVVTVEAFGTDRLGRVVSVNRSFPSNVVYTIHAAKGRAFEIHRTADQIRPTA